MNAAMWNTGKFDARSGQGLEATLRPTIFLQPEGVRGRTEMHFGLGVGLILNGFYEPLLPFLTGSSSQTECHVTHSKRRTAISSNRGQNYC